MSVIVVVFALLALALIVFHFVMFCISLWLDIMLMAIGFACASILTAWASVMLGYHL